MRSSTSAEPAEAACRLARVEGRSFTDGGLPGALQGLQNGVLGQQLAKDNVIRANDITESRCVTIDSDPEAGFGGDGGNGCDPLSCDMKYNLENGKISIYMYC